MFPDCCCKQWCVASASYFISFTFFQYHLLTSDIEDQSSSYIRLRPLTQDRGDNWLRTGSSWLTECLNGHEDCCRQSWNKTFPPTRVIDVGPADGSETPFLHTSGKEVQEWVTLSHCWGQNVPLKTTSLSLSNHQRELPLNVLPKLFHDAVLITRGFGYRYLWIDSICIIQDSKEDWIQESADMGNIYKHCVFTIAADNCRDSRDNILGNHGSIHTNYVQQGCCSSKAMFHSTMYAFSGRKWDRNHLSDYSRLGSRGWALQEQVLSPRTLHWTPLQIAWSCRCTTRSEEDPSGGRPRLVMDDAPDAVYPYPTKLICLSHERFQIAKQDQFGSPKSARKCNPLQIWYYLTMQFCARKITFEEDSLPAISGLAKEVKRLTGDHYHAGIWARDYHNGLLWSTDGKNLSQPTYVAPSWSWVSINKGTVVHPACIGPNETLQFNGGELAAVKHTAKILETQIIYAGGDEFGPILSGKLRINAPFKLSNAFGKSQVRLPWLEDKLTLSNSAPFMYKMQPSTITCWLDTSRGEKVEEGDGSGVHFHLGEHGAAFVHIASVDTSRIVHDTKSFYRKMFNGIFRHQSWALILKPAVGDANEWKRIGVARIADDLIDGWETRDFTIL